MSPPHTPIIKMKLVPADANHYADNGGVKMGMMYFLRRMDGDFDPRPYYTHRDMNIGAFRVYFRNDQVYEPVNPDADVEFEEKEL